MSKWLKRAKEEYNALKERKASETQAQAIPTPTKPTASSGFLCALCNNEDLGSLESLQAHYLEKHSNDDEEEDTGKSLAPDVKSDPPGQDPVLETAQHDSKNGEATSEMEALKQELNSLKEASAEEVNVLSTKLEAATLENQRVLSLQRDLEEAKSARDSDLQTARNETNELQEKCRTMELDLMATKEKVVKAIEELNSRPYPEEVEALKNEVAALKSSTSDAQNTDGVTSNTSANPAALARANGEISVLKRQLSQLEPAKSQADEKIAVLEASLSESRSNVTDTRAKLDETRKSLDESEKQRKSDQESLSLLQRAVEAEKSLRSKESTKLINMQVSLSDRTAELMSKTSTIEKLEKQLAEKGAASDKIDNLQNELKTLREEIKAKDQELVDQKKGDEYVDKSEILEQQLERLQKKMEAKNKDVLELRDKIVEYKDLLENSKAEKAALRTKLREEGKLASNVSEKVNTAMQVSNTLQRAVEDAQNQLKKQMSEYETKLTELSANKDKEADLLRTRIATLESDLEAVGLDIAQMAQKTDSSGAEAQQLTAQLKEAQKKTTSAEEELQQVKATLEARCAELESTNSSIVANEKELKSKISSLEREAKFAETTVAELEASNVELETEMGEIAKKYRQSQKDAKALHGLIENTKKLFITQKVDLQREAAATKEVLVKTQISLQESEAEKEKVKSRSVNELSTLRRHSEIAEKANDELRRQLASTKDELGSELKILQSSLSSAQQRLEASTQNIARLQEVVDTTSAEKRTAKSALESVTAEKEELVKRCMATEKKLNMLANKFNTLNQDLKDRTAALTELGEENQELQRTMNEMGSRQWASSKGIKNCSDCDKKFSTKIRKHHCRNCGQIFCNTCSSKTAKTSASKSKVRVCDACYQDLS